MVAHFSTAEESSILPTIVSDKVDELSCTDVCVDVGGDTCCLGVVFLANDIVGIPLNEMIFVMMSIFIPNISILLIPIKHGTRRVSNTVATTPNSKFASEMVKYVSSLE